MKLWLKVFVSILLMSELALVTGAGVMISRIHIQNVSAQQDRSVSEFDLMIASIETAEAGKGDSDDHLATVIKRFSDYYSARGVWLAVIENGIVVFDGIGTDETTSYDSLANPGEETMLGKIADLGNRRCIMLSSRYSGDTVLVYIRDISEIYESRLENMRLFIFIAASMSVLLAVSAFMVSRSITRPLAVLRRGADAIANREYETMLPEGRDEIGSLAGSFNKMSLAIEAREAKLLEQAEERQLFIDDMSHEMNTPLTSIQGYSDLLLNANISEEQRYKAAKRIKDETQRIKEMYNKLMVLTVTREPSLDMSEIDARELIGEVAEELSAGLREKNIDSIIRIEKEKIIGDKTLLHIFFSNLIRNSITYSCDKGEITVASLASSDGFTVLEVADKGIGIPTDMLSKVTEPFCRVDKSRSRESGGAGLGLAICKRIAETHGGKLEITSELGSGTTIRMIY